MAESTEAKWSAGKTITIFGMFVVVLLALGILFVSASTGEAQEGQYTKPVIALVNDDVGGKLNGTSYTLGKQFVDQISNDPKYTWNVVSDSLAKKSYNEGAVDAVVYLPGTFTQDVLTFQDLHPTKPVVSYSVRQTSDQLSNQSLDNEIKSVLYSFNQNLVEMFYASVASNVSNAVDDMNNSVSSQSAMVGDLSNKVKPSLSEAGDDYSFVVPEANGLKSENTAWIDQQNAFTNSTVNTLNSTSSSLLQQLPTMSDYFTLQKTIADTNLTDANAGITSQADSDAKFYNSQYESLYNQAKSTLDTFVSSDANSPTSQLNNTVTAYNDKISGVKADLQTQQSTLTAQKAKLEALEQNLLSEYFNQTLTVSDSNYNSPNDGVMSSDNARTALAQKVATSFASNGSFPSQYSANISNSLIYVPADQTVLRKYLDDLVSTGYLSSDSRNAYDQALTLIGNYNAAFGGANGSFNLVLPSNTTDQSTSKTLPVTVPKGQKATVTLSNNNWNTGMTITQVDNGGTVNGLTATLDNSAGTSDVTYHITYTVDLGQQAAETVTASVFNNTTWVTTTYTDTFVLDPANATSESIAGNFTTITNTLSNLYTAAWEINFLYGDPTDAVQTLGNKKLTTKAGFQSASPNSLYSLYGHVSPDSIRTGLSDADVASYQKLGTDNINSVINAIGDLNTAGAGLSADINTLSTNMPADYFANTIKSLNDWYDQASSAITYAYQNTWQTNSTITLKALPWTQHEDTPGQLYLDDQAGPSLYQSLNTLVSSSAKQASDTAKSAQIIQDNSAEFDALVQATAQTAGATQNALDTTNNTISTGSKALLQSTGYAQNFSGTLANARAQNGDPKAVYDFFANPLNVQDDSQTTPAATKPGFDWRFLETLLFGLTLGLAAAYTYKTIRDRQRQLD